MKTRITLLIIGLAMISCHKWDYGHHGDDDKKYKKILVDEGEGSAAERIEIIPNEIIVRYGDADPVDIANIRADIQNKHPLMQIQPCDCGNMDLWSFEESIDELEVEGVISGLPDRNPAGKVRGDQAFNIFLPKIEPFTPQGQSGEPGFIAKSSSSSLNIAIIDTGIDFYRKEISSSSREILYPSGLYDDNCLSTQSGWNFLGQNDENRPDDIGNQDILDQNGHGTYVTKIITDMLDSQNVEYQILPLKVFDFEGKGSYWDVLCAMAYIKKINESGGHIDIVNASFGGAMPPEIFKLDALGNKSIFAELLDELNAKKTLVVTSAGNKGLNNEAGIDRDFLSFFNADNLLTVGGYDDDLVRPVTSEVMLHEDSNYGKTSIDIALAFNDYKLIFEDSPGREGEEVTLNGTSYSAAAMSAFAAVAMRDAGTRLPPTVLKNVLFNLPSVQQSSNLTGKIVKERALLRE